MGRGRSLVPVAVILAGAASARAQERMEVLAYGTSGQSPAMAEIDVGVSGFGTVRHVSDVAVEPRAPASVVAAAGGRYLVWATPRQYPQDPGNYAIFDRRTRALTTIPTPVYWGLLGDRIRPRVFLLREPVMVFDFRTGTERVAAPAAEGSWERSRVAYAARADRLAILERQSSGGAFNFRARIADVATATTIASFPLPAATPFFSTALEVSDDGTLIYVREPSSGAILAYDTALGVEVARSAATGSLVLDHDRQLLHVQSAQGQLIVLHARTLQTLAVLPVASGDDGFQVIPGRDATGAYVLRTRITGPTSCVVDLDALDLTGQRRATTRLSDTLNGRSPWCVASFAGAVVVRNPAPPSGLAAHVAGGTVTLSWQTPGDTTDFELEVGFAPGTTAVRVPVGDATVVGAAGVLPGTYYLRVRARNEVGTSSPSTQLRVDVP